MWKVKYKFSIEYKTLLNNIPERHHAVSCGGSNSVIRADVVFSLGSWTRKSGEFVFFAKSA